MKAEHVKAMLWLRWTLSVRLWRRASAAGFVVAVLTGIAAVVIAFVGFGISFGLGMLLLPRAGPEELLLAWNGVVVAFLFFWAIGVMTELQRTEPLSLSKLLHLPVSLDSAFLLNYASSWLCLSQFFWLPMMLGLCLASTMRFGPASLSLAAPILGLMFMVTALTHQLRGWLASLMTDKRKRGTVIGAITIVFVVVANIPGLAGLYFDRDDGPDGAEPVAEALVEGEGLGADERAAVRTASLVLPPGWLGYASMGAQRGNPLPALLTALGTMAIAGVSLARSYRTTLRLYRSGGTGSPKKARVPSERDAAKDHKPGLLDRMVEWDLPYSPPHAAAIATSALRMLMRAPHIKMVLLTPVILLAVFAGLLAKGGLDKLPEPLVPLLGLAAIGMAMLTIAQLLQNLFGFDGDGFRVFVLSAAPREEILLGKNLAHAPMGLGLGLMGLVMLQVVMPLSASHFVASVLQLPCIYLVCCLVGNLGSILAPMAMSSGTLQPNRPNGMTVVKQIVFALLIPVAMAPTTIPLAIEMLVGALRDGGSPPIYLILSVLEVPAVWWIYRKALTFQGSLLALRERQVLEVVTKTL